MQLSPLCGVLVCMSSPLLVIYNPVAGRGRVRDAWPQVEQALRQAGVAFEAVATRAPLDATQLARQAAGSSNGRYQGVVAIGGDGTLHEALNGLLQASGEQPTLPLGIIPLGNGDDFAKVVPPEAPVGGKPFDWRTAVQIIAAGRTRLFDAVRMQGDHLRPDLGSGPHYLANGMDVGFGALATLNFLTIPRFLKGMTAYTAAILKTMIAYPTLRIRIQLDDQPFFEQTTTMTAVTNGRCFANGFWVCPQAQADDGLLDLMVADAVSRLTILNLIPKITKGTHTAEPVLKMLRARRVVIESDAPLVVEADGELPYLETHRLELTVLPRVMRLYA